MEASSVCVVCGGSEWNYKIFRTTDGKILCNRCRHIGRALLNTDLFTIRQLKKELGTREEEERIYHRYLRSLIKKYLIKHDKYDRNKLEAFIKETVDVERKYAETFIKKHRLTMTMCDVVEMINALIDTTNQDVVIDSRVRMSEFIEIYEKEVNRK